MIIDFRFLKIVLLLTNEVGCFGQKRENILNAKQVSGKDWEKWNWEIGKFVYCVNFTQIIGESFNWDSISQFPNLAISQLLNRITERSRVRRNPSQIRALALASTSFSPLKNLSFFHGISLKQIGK